MTAGEGVEAVGLQLRLDVGELGAGKHLLGHFGEDDGRAEGTCRHEAQPEPLAQNPNAEDHEGQQDQRLLVHQVQQAR